MTGDVTPFTDLVTSEHQDKPNFMSMVGLLCQPLSDLIILNQSFASKFYVDQAEGEQLDYIGKWVGVSRELTEVLTGVFFSFDTERLGFDEGVWFGRTSTITGLTVLPDDQYRLLIKARILNNRWDADIPDAYEIGSIIFEPLGYSIFIEDHNDLTMNFGLIGEIPPDVLTWKLLTGGYLNLKPIGVRILYYYASLTPGPLFAFDLDNTYFSGFDSGTWARITPAT